MIWLMLKMVATRGKKMAVSSNRTLEEEEAAENGLAEMQSDLLTVDVVKPNEDTQLDDGVGLVTDKARSENLEELHGEGEELPDVDNKDPSMPEFEENTFANGEIAETQSDLLTVDVAKPNEDTQLDNGVGLVADEPCNENLGELLGKGEEVPEVDNEDPIMPEFEENNFPDDEIDDQHMLFEGEEEPFELKNEERVLDDYDDNEEEASDEDDGDAEVSGEEATEDDEVSGEEEIKKENDEANNQDEKENTKQVAMEAKAKDEGEVKEDGIEKSEARSKNIKKRNGRTAKKKVQASKLKKVDSQDKPESSHQRKVKKRVESMGMIFMCSSETKKDCHKYKVLGLPENKKNIVEKIYTGMRLFLYDIDLKLMYGIYKAAGPGGYNIEPKAFKQQFPSQVRFKVLENCLPLAEEKFKAVIKANYFTRSKFDGKLNSEQVKKLCKLFTASSKGRQPKKSGKSLKAEKQPVRQEKNERQKTGDKRRLPLREDARRHERPRKRQRKVITQAAVPRKHLPAPIPSTVPASYVYVRASDAHAYGQERHSPNRDRHVRPLIPLDPYRGVGVPPIVRNEHYRDGRDNHLERRYAYRSGRDSHVDRHDPYRDDVDPYSRRRDPVPYTDGRAPYVELRDPYIERREFYRDGQDPYTGRHDSYRDGRASYLEHRVPYGDSAHSELYSTYRRHPLPDNGVVYREERGIAFRQDELSNHRFLHPLDSETRNHHAYVGPSSLYPSAYPSRSHVHRI